MKKQSKYSEPEQDDLEIWSDLLKIDKNDLDEELVMQGDYLRRIGMECAAAIDRRDTAKENMKFVWAEVSDFERQQFITDKVKPTDKMVESAATQNEDYQAALKKYMRAKRRADELEALRESFRAKGFVLKDLVALYLGDYFAVNSVKGENSNRAQAKYVDQRRDEQYERGPRRKRTRVDT